MNTQEEYRLGPGALLGRLLPGLVLVLLLVGCETSSPATPTAVPVPGGPTGSPAAPATPTSPVTPTPTPAPALLGRWEKVSPRDEKSDGNAVALMSTGDLLEFFGGETFAFFSQGGSYAWLDEAQDRLKLQFTSGNLVPAGTFIYQVTLVTDTLTLTDGYQHAQQFARYVVLTPTLQTLAGTWNLGRPNDSSWFGGLQLDHSPPQIVLAADGSLSIDERTNLGGVTQISLSGTYTFTQSQITLSAQGSSQTGPIKTPLRGTVIRKITLSNNRLEFQDPDKRTTVYWRANP